MDEEKYEGKSILRSSTEEFMPINTPSIKLPIPMLESDTTKSAKMDGGLLRLHSSLNFKKIPIPMLKSRVNVNKIYYLNHHMDF
jgi:hypothetical protein